MSQQLSTNNEISTELYFGFLCFNLCHNCALHEAMRCQITLGWLLALHVKHLSLNRKYCVIKINTDEYNTRMSEDEIHDKTMWEQTQQWHTKPTWYAKLHSSVRWLHAFCSRKICTQLICIINQCKASHDKGDTMNSSEIGTDSCDEEDDKDNVSTNKCHCRLVLEIAEIFVMVSHLCFWLHVGIADFKKWGGGVYPHPHCWAQTRMNVMQLPIRHVPSLLVCVYMKFICHSRCTLQLIQ